mmetsp:Transcript_33442/g.50449  ORF Transcript_33442/g.50449 Transcript_33442/m.50449 type:complete len:562 (+) Transcript_33442:176-1861(+)|eukprot:CAMPEP_0178919546 /NCGR_PEP_ID=MMETSP0786-20121207/14496_1 /TAXON_ID=186022 /ORGANISM="Thalassionema frauenfeldii, Strain CCMP 1798" /LENGTH=561 /DNA_ID=CAMNT_0020593487 /DNA_START=112 /DNA_END=1797 /DNA_ORIENTATION=+
MQQVRFILALQCVALLASAFFTKPVRNSFGFRQRTSSIFSEVSDEVAETTTAVTTETPVLDHDEVSTTLEETGESPSIESEEEVASEETEKVEERFTVYVRNLPYSMEDKELEELFAECGTVKALSVPRRRDTKEAKGYAFVDMNTKEEMDLAIEKLNGRELGGREITTAESLPKGEVPKKQKKRERVSSPHRMYVGNLPYGVLESDIEQLFSEHGTVTDVFLGRDSNGQDRGFGFVTLSAEEEVSNAINTLNGQFFQGRRLTVRSPNPVGSTANKEEFDDATRVYFGNLSFDTTTQTMIDLFEQHGKVLSLFINEDINSKRSRGYGFANMPKEDAERAISALNGMEVDGRSIKVTEAAARVEKKRIYVGNLSFETDEDTIRSTFGEHGKIISVYYPGNKDGSGNRGFAIVTMKEEDALKAIEELNDTDIDGRTIKVNEAMPQGTNIREMTTKMYVGNLDFDTTEDVLKDAFAQYGVVRSCILPEDKDFGGSRGFGFVTMASEDAKTAMDELDGVELDGRSIRVSEANGGRSGGSSYYDDDYDSNDGYDDGYDDDDYYDDN